MVLATHLSTPSAPSTPPTPATPGRRVELLELAVELEVDKEDFIFLNPAEEALWDELTEEFERRTERMGRVWLAG